MSRLLHIDSSARNTASVSRQVAAYAAQQLASPDDLIHRDLATTDLPLLSEAHVNAYFTQADKRSDEQKDLLSLSDILIGELKSVNHLVIAAPMYNFSVPAALKAWIDLVCRAGETFAYTEKGPQGLLDIEHAIIVVTTGGTPLGSPVDFSSAYLQQICRFIGVKQSHVIDVSGSKREASTLVDVGKEKVDQVLLQNNLQKTVSQKAVSIT